MNPNLLTVSCAEPAPVWHTTELEPTNMFFSGTLPKVPGWTRALSKTWYTNRPNVESLKYVALGLRFGAVPEYGRPRLVPVHGVPTVLQLTPPRPMAGLPRRFGDTPLLWAMKDAPECPMMTWKL